MKQNRKVIRYSARYSKKARAKRFILNFLLTVLIIATVSSLGLIITGYVIEDNKPNNPNSPMESSSDKESSFESDQQDDSSLDESSTSNKQPEELQQKLSCAVTMPLDVILSDTKREQFLQNAKEKNFQAVLFEVKNTNGEILYQSDIELAAKCHAISANAFDLTAVVDEIHAVGLKAAVSFATLQDPKAASVDYKTSYKYADTNYTWLDNSPDRGGKPWMNPYEKSTQQYLVDITTELKQAGCDILIADKMIFPTQYTSKLNQGNSTISRQDMLSELAGKMTDAANGCEIIFCFDAESYYGKNTEQYDGTPGGISGLRNVAVRIDPKQLSSIPNFKEIDLSTYNTENLTLILDEVKTQHPDAKIVPIFMSSNIADEIKQYLEEQKISLYLIE